MSHLNAMQYEIRVNGLPHKKCRFFVIAHDAATLSPAWLWKCGSFPTVLRDPNATGRRRNFDIKMSNSQSPPSSSLFMASRDSLLSSGWHKANPNPTAEKSVFK